MPNGLEVSKTFLVFLSALRRSAEENQIGLKILFKKPGLMLIIRGKGRFCNVKI